MFRDPLLRPRLAFARRSVQFSSTSFLICRSEFCFRRATLSIGLISRDLLAQSLFGRADEFAHTHDTLRASDEYQKDPPTATRSPNAHQENVSPTDIRELESGKENYLHSLKVGRRCSE